MEAASPLCFLFFFFFALFSQAAWLTQEAEKKLSREQENVASGHAMPRGMHRVYLNKLGDGHHVYVCAWPCLSRSA